MKIARAGASTQLNSVFLNKSQFSPQIAVGEKKFKHLSKDPGIQGSGGFLRKGPKSVGGTRALLNNN